MDPKIKEDLEMIEIVIEEDSEEEAILIEDQEMVEIDQEAVLTVGKKDTLQNSAQNVDFILTQQDNQEIITEIEMTEMEEEDLTIEEVTEVTDAEIEIETEKEIEIETIVIKKDNQVKAVAVTVVAEVIRKKSKEEIDHRPLQEADSSLQQIK